MKITKGEKVLKRKEVERINIINKSMQKMMKKQTR